MGRRWLSEAEYVYLVQRVAGAAGVEPGLWGAAGGRRVGIAGLVRRRAWVVVALMGEVGLRVGEVSRLRWEDVGGVLCGEGVVSLPKRVGKGGRPRVLVVTRGLRVALWWGAVALVEAGRWHWGGAVAGIGVGGRAMSVRGLQRVVGRMGERTLGRRLSPHDLRRTYGDRCRQHGDVRIAQLMLGHARLATTERYLGERLEERLAVARALDAAVSPGSVEAVGELTLAAGGIPALGGGAG